MAIVAECDAVQGELEAQRQAAVEGRYFSNFPRAELARERHREMAAWTPEKRRQATAEVDEDNRQREVLGDVRSDLDDPSGPNGRSLRGAHSIKVPRAYNSRKQIFAEAARRLKEARGWQISPRTVEQIWNGWRSQLRREDPEDEPSV